MTLAVPALVQTASIANGGNGTSITATLASTPVAGNLLIAVAGNRTFSGVAAIPSGWNVAIDETGNAPGQLIIYKTAGGSEPPHGRSSRASAHM